MTNKQIQEDVMNELEWDPEVDSSEVGVAVEDGIVTLSGEVKSYAAKLAAEKAAKRVRGVKGIAQEIVVKYIGMARTDADIADAAVNAIKWNTTIPDDKVTVKVEKGWVTLEGEVEWDYQRRAAERTVEKIKGVKDVTNLITIKPRVQSSIVKGNIKRALERRADIEADNIEVETEGNNVVLRGSVGTWNEREEAQRAAWSAPGVMHVDNHLTVSYS
jgi:osmotically-inducible protein OsmY